MRIGKTLLFLGLIALSVTSGFLVGQQNNAIVIAQKKPIPKPFALLSQLEKEKIKEIKVLETDDTKLYGVISEIDEPPTKDSMFKTSDKLSLKQTAAARIVFLKSSSTTTENLRR
jgi:hypothetical protein